MDRSKELPLQASLTVESETQLGSRESGLDSKQPKKPHLEILYGKNAVPGDEVVCKLCKLPSAYHSPASNMRAHLEKVHPNEHGLMSGTPAQQPLARNLLRSHAKT